MQKTLVLQKPLGKTPLTLLNDYRKTHPEYTNVKIGYAGRLDPMAEGLVLYLIGDENKNREKYLGFDKEYDVEILFGIETESYDVLGLIKQTFEYDNKEILKKVEKVLLLFIGEVEQSFPPYSSKPFNGKPMYYWARRGDLEGVELPKEKRTIFSLKKIGRRFLDKDKLQGIIAEKLSYVEGDFNQDMIKKRWEEYFAKTNQSSWVCITVHVHCSSGTYMRSLAHEIGKAVCMGACALSIKRTKIGPYEKPHFI